MPEAARGTVSGGVTGSSGGHAAEARLEALIGSRFDALMAASPALATSLGIHAYDGRLADLGRGAMEDELAAERSFIRELEAIDPAALSPRPRFERELALHGARLRRFEREVVRGWERVTGASDEIGTSLFLLLARDFAPLAERLASMTSRLEAIPAALLQVRERLGEEPVQLWLELEERAARELPQLLDEITLAADRAWPRGGPPSERLRRAGEAASTALVDYADWVRAQLARGGERVALGADELDELIALRAFDGLDRDDILAIGYEQLEAMHRARREAGRAIDPSLDEAGIVERVKADGPTDFETALAGYRDAMLRARDFIAERDLATLPADDHIEVVPTPTYLRSTIPLAAYFEAAPFDQPSRGVYIVTPSVDGDQRAMAEHNWASIVNTSVHEAYPGHHLQSTAAAASPSPARLLSDAPDFHEGWAMYCEQMMLEQGFEDTAARRVIVATDAIWRAARIVIDIRLHRGELGVEEAVELLVKHTGFERPVARAEVQRYTQSPGYNLSYLLGKVLLLRLRDDERRRLGEGFSLKRFHDALLYSGDLPVSFHRRLLAGEGGGPTLPGSDAAG